MRCMWYVVLVVSAQGEACSSSPTSCQSSGSNFLQFGSRVRSCSPFGDWPQVDGVTCGGCRALVQTTSYNRCDRYCESFGHVCAAAAEEVADNCEVLEDKACDEEILGTSDMLCTCKLSTAEENCYGSLPALAASEGTHAGKVSTNSLAECQKECDGKANCKSFSFCPQWNGCFLKERVLTGSEPTVTKGKCRSYFKTSCGGSTTATTTVTATTTTTKTTTLAATTTTAESGTCWSSLGALATSEGNGLGAVSDISPGKCQSACDAKAGCNSFSFCPQWGKCFLKDRSFTGSEPSAVKGSCETYFRIDCSLTTTTTTFAVGEGNLKAMIVSYNLYWWNAFNQNSWKSDGIIDNLRYTLKPDSAGLQECDSASTVQSRTGRLEPASPFKGAQGVMVKPGLFSKSDEGSRDLDATGKWGARYVTWVKLTHISTGKAFWHFNTHWCVHSEGSRICNEDVRYRGAKNMVSAIQEHAKEEPVVITGDFNAALGEKGPQHFLKSGFKLAERSWVDMIFYSHHWQLLSHGVGKEAGSDHKPVFAELAL